MFKKCSKNVQKMFKNTSPALQNKGLKLLSIFKNKFITHG